jgi:hypothetical protein
MSSFGRHPIHLFDDELTFGGDGGGKSLFNDSLDNDTNLPESPLSRHVRQFDEMVSGNVNCSTSNKPSLNMNALNHPLNRNNTGPDGPDSPDTPRTLAFRQKIESLSLASRFAATSSSEGRRKGSKKSQSPSYDFAFGNSTPRLPTKDYNQHGLQQPEMWPHQKSQETNNEAQDNFDSQKDRKSSIYSSGHFTGGADRWRQTPVPSSEEYMTQMNTKNTNNKYIQQQQRQFYISQQGSESAFGSSSSAFRGGPEIVLVSDGMDMDGSSGNPFEHAPPPPPSRQPRLNGAAGRTGEIIISRTVPQGISPNSVQRNEAKKLMKLQNQRRIVNQQNIQLVQALPNVQKNIDPPLSCGKDLEIHQLNHRSHQRRSGARKGNGPRVRRKNPGPKKTLSIPSYMRPTAATNNWKNQTSNVKKMSKSERKVSFHNDVPRGCFFHVTSHYNNVFARKC